MTIEVIKTDTKESFAQLGKITATCTQWSNLEGCNIIVQDGRQTILHGSLRWEELELLNAASALLKAQ